MLPSDSSHPLLRDLRPLQLTDLPRFKQAIADGEQQGWSYFFPYLLFVRLGSQSSRMIWVEDEGSICLFKHQYGRKKRLDLIFPPFPYQEPVLLRALERVNDFNQAFSSWVYFIDEKDMPMVQAVKIFRVSKRNPQYLFSPRELANLSGSGFRNLRRNINTAQRQAEIHIQPYSPKHATQCRQLLAYWENRKENKPRDLAYQNRYALNAFLFAPQMEPQNLHGHVFIVNEQVRAFTFGGEIRPDIGCLLLAIADPLVTCLSYLVRQHFFANMQKCRVVNDGTDGGENGLKEMKQRFRPCGLHTVFQAKQVSRLPTRLSPVPAPKQTSRTLPPKLEYATVTMPINLQSTGAYPHARYELRPSRMLPDQVGLFALMPFRAEEVVAPYSDFDESRLITWEELETLDETTRYKVMQYCYKDKKGIHAPKNINAIRICYFINHSCDPNLYCNKNGDFIALRDISAREELTADLEKNMKRTCLEFTCGCGSKQCRKIVRI